MSDTSIDLSTFDPDDPEAAPSDLREAAKRGLSKARELEATRRELALVKAGIDVDDPKAKYFVKGYDGDLSKDEIVRAATEAGLIAPSAPPQSTAPPVDLSAQQRVMTAAAGGQSEDVTMASAESRLAEALASGGIEAMMEVAQSMGVRIAQP